jgi:hypothetical protein
MAVTLGGRPARSADHPLRLSISKSSLCVIATNPDGAQSWAFHALADIAADPSREIGMIANPIWMRRTNHAAPSA